METGMEKAQRLDHDVYAVKVPTLCRAATQGQSEYLLGHGSMLHSILIQ
jgi:hypothetical protein